MSRNLIDFHWSTVVQLGMEPPAVVPNLDAFEDGCADRGSKLTPLVNDC